MPKLSQHNKPWTKQEVAQLKKLYHKVVHREIAAQLNRTVSAVESKAIELGITRKMK
ncbi:MAG: hypothetical protein HY868_00290 [Chloroflexi bacterium]|nr:hypothetical protein [Chloroflexota bacterium]